MSGTALHKRCLNKGDADNHSANHGTSKKYRAVVVVVDGEKPDLRIKPHKYK